MPPQTGTYLDDLPPEYLQTLEEERRRSSGQTGSGTYLDDVPPEYRGGQFEGLPPIDPGEDPLTYIRRRSVPFLSALWSFKDTREYQQATDRLAAGTGRPEDEETAATYRVQQQRDQERGTLGQIGSGLAHVPALIGEAVAGGAVVGRLPMLGQAAPLISRAAVSSPGALAGAAARTAAQTAVMPSMYLPQAAERAVQQGGEWYEPSNLGPAFTMGFAQTAILGSLPQFANGIPGPGVAAASARLATRTAIGMGEQQIVDAAFGVFDNVLPEAYQLKTRYGLLGDAFRGEWGEFGKHLAVQAATFAAFSALHPILHGERGAEPTAPTETSPVRPPGPQPMSEPTQMPGFMRPRPVEPAQPSVPTGPYERPGQQESASAVARGPMDLRGPQRVSEELIPGRVVPDNAIPYTPPVVPDISPSRRVFTALEKALDSFHSSGFSKEAAARQLDPVATRIAEAVKAKGSALTPQEASAIVDGFRGQTPKITRTLREFAEELIRSPGITEARMPGEMLPERADRPGRPSVRDAYRPELPQEPPVQPVVAPRPVVRPEVTAGQPVRPKGKIGAAEKKAAKEARRAAREESIEKDLDDMFGEFEGSAAPSAAGVTKDFAGKKITFTTELTKFPDTGKLSGGTVSLADEAGNIVGNATFTRDEAARRLVERAIPNMDKSAQVMRMNEIEMIDPLLRGKGIGAETYLRAMNAVEGRPYFYNSQIDAPAMKSLEGLAKRGLIELHKLGGEQHVKRITEAGQNYLSAARQAGEIGSAPRGEAAPPARAQTITDAIGNTPTIKANELLALGKILDGQSLREAGLEIGRSRTTVAKDAELAFQKVREANPEFTEHKTLSDYLGSIKEVQRETLAVEESNVQGERGKRESRNTEDQLRADMERLAEIKKWPEAERRSRLAEIEADIEGTHQLEWEKSRGEVEQAGQRAGRTPEEIRVDLEEALAQYRQLAPGEFSGERAGEVPGSEPGQAGRVSEPADAGRTAPADSGVPAGQPSKVEALRARIAEREATFRPRTPRAGAVNLEPLADVARFGKSVIDSVKKIAERFAADPGEVRIANRPIGRRGEIDLGPAKEKVKAFGNRMLGTYERFVDEVGQLSGKSFVAMTRIANSLGEAASRFTAHKTWTAEAIPDFLESLGGKKPTAENDLRNMAGLGEMIRRHAKEHGNKEAKSFIGDEGMPFQTEAQFQAWRNSPEANRFLDAYKGTMTDPLHKFFKMNKGMIEDADLISTNQIPDLPFNFKRLTEAEMIERAAGNDPSVRIGGSRAGDLGNIRQKKLIFDQAAERSLPFEAYDWNMANVITNSLTKAAVAGTKAEYYREAQRVGLAVEGPAGKENVLLPNGERTEAFPGSKTALSLYVSERIAKEFRQSLALDHPANVPFLTDAAKLINKANILLPLQEGVSHIKNQGTSMFAPGVIPIYDHVMAAWKLYNGDPSLKADYLKLAEIGAGRAKGLETGQFWGGKTDPTSWMSNFIHLTDKVSRLALKAGHERNVRLNRVADTETNVRDFVNQGLGNYNKLTQHKLVVWLRDLGLGPYATAATNFYMQGMRALGIGPMIEATSTAHAIGMRAEMIGKAAAVLGIAFALNKSMWNNILGDDDTPMGAIKTGKTADGKTTYLDLTNFTGLTRGMRQTGLLALTEGVRQGTSIPRIADRAADQWFAGMMHAAEGPAVSFAHTAMTGKNAIGMSVARTPPPSGSHLLENVQAAAVHANPVTATFLGHDRRHEDMTWGQKALELMGPYNPFRQRGDAVLSEMHGRLREVEDARKVFNAQPGNLGRAFPREAEHNVLRRLDASIQRLESVMKGQARAAGGVRQLPNKPPPEQVARLRAEVSRLAKLALEVSGKVR